jgi:hypothetical protein
VCDAGAVSRQVRFAQGRPAGQEGAQRPASALIVIPTAPSGAVVLEAVKCGLGSARQARCTPQGRATGNLASSLRAPALQTASRGEETGRRVEQRNRSRQKPRSETTKADEWRPP